MLPQHLLDEYNTQIANLWSVYREVFEPHTKAIKNALIKYNKTKDPVSQASITVMRNLLSDRPMSIHPALIG